MEIGSILITRECVDKLAKEGEESFSFACQKCGEKLEVRLIWDVEKET